jgi:hypothetical protein
MRAAGDLQVWETVDEARWIGVPLSDGRAASEDCERSRNQLAELVTAEPVTFCSCGHSSRP